MSDHNHCQWDGGKVYTSSVTGILLSLQGSEGVEQVLQILKDEFKLAMTLSGNPHRCYVFRFMTLILYYLQGVHSCQTLSQRWWSMNLTINALECNKIDF